MKHYKRDGGSGFVLGMNTSFVAVRPLNNNYISGTLANITNPYLVSFLPPDLWYENVML